MFSCVAAAGGLGPINATFGSFGKCEAACIPGFYPPPPPPPPMRPQVLYSDTDIDGVRVGSDGAPKSWLQCKTSCAGKSGCAGFTYDNRSRCPEGPCCWLKAAPLKPVYSSGRLSMVLKADDEAASPAANCSFHGGAFHSCSYAVYPHRPRIHFARGCILGMKTHDISGAVILNGEYHVWVGCFMSQVGGGWSHIMSKDMVNWRIEEPFQLRWNGTERFVQAGAVGVSDDDGGAFAVECSIDAPGQPSPWREGKPAQYNFYSFTNATNNAWRDPIALFDVYAARFYPGDPPRPFMGADGRWRAILSFDACNSTLPTHPSEAGNCSGGGSAPMWSSPALRGPQADWQYEGVLLQTNATVLSGKQGLPLRSNRHEFVTSDFFPVAGHPHVNAVFVTSLYGVIVNDSNPQIRNGNWNQLVAYVGHQPTPGAPMQLLPGAAGCVCLDWGNFVRTTGWHGIDAATTDGLMYGIGKTMRTGPPDTGRRVLLAWMNNGFSSGAHDGRTDNNETNQILPRDALSLPRDLSFNPEGRLLQSYVPELLVLRRGHERLAPRRLADEEVWLATRGRQLELFARFEVAVSANASFGLQVCAGNFSERTVLGINTTDDLAYIDRTLSSGRSPLLLEQADVRAGLLPPPPNGTAATRVFELHAYVDGPIVTMIVNNETAISAYVYPQRNESIGVAAWASGTVEAASVSAWELAAVEVRR